MGYKQFPFFCIWQHTDMIAQARCLISDDIIERVLRVGQILREELPLLGPSLPACQDNPIGVSLLVSWPASVSLLILSFHSLNRHFFSIVVIFQSMNRITHQDLNCKVHFILAYPFPVASDMQFGAQSRMPLQTRNRRGVLYMRWNFLVASLNLTYQVC